MAMSIGYDSEEERIIELIISRHGKLSRSEIEKLIEEKMRLKHVSRKTALYLLSIELGVRLDSPVEERLNISSLTGGLSNVSIVGRILWLKDTIQLTKRPGVQTRGGIGDASGYAPIIFWDISREELEENGVFPGVVVEINNCYTRMNITGRVEIHVSRRSVIHVRDDLKDFPSLTAFIKPLHEIDVSNNYVNVYGIVISKAPAREIKINDNYISVSSLTLASNDKSYRVVLWRDAVTTYNWISVGDKIVIYDGKVKINKFGELEIHVSNTSHIEMNPNLDVKLKPKIARLRDVVPGHNLSKIYVRILSIGKDRVNPELGRLSLTLYVIDDTGDASLTITGNKVNEIKNLIKPMDTLSIEFFRASIRGGNLFLFADEGSNIEINPRDTPHILPVYTVPFRTASTLSTVDKIINMEGRIVEFLSEESLTVDIPTFNKSILVEDTEGNPVKILYRDNLANYTDDDLKEGDSVIFYGLAIDMSSFLLPGSIPTLRLRAYSRIERK